MPFPMRKWQVPHRGSPARPGARTFSRTVACGAVLVGAAVVAGCGGGLYYDGEFDDPPEVDLAVSADVAAPGDTVRLVAAASDDYRVDRVEFRRIDLASDVLLGSDERSPWQWDFTVPNVAAGTVLRFSARAIDDAGQRSNSATVEVLVR